MLRTLAIAAFGIGYLIAADEDRQKARTVTIQHVEFAPGGLLHLKNSIGFLTIEGWNRPEVEITTTRSTKAAYSAQESQKAADDLDQVRSTVERHGDEVILVTDFKRGGALSPPLRGGTRFELDYRIKAPHDARLTIEHETGEVHLNNMRGEMHVTVVQGEISVYLPDEVQYSIDARSKFGGVSSNVAGRVQRRSLFLGQAFVHEDAAAARKMYLRVGSGDILILRTIPPQPR